MYIFLSKPETTKNPTLPIKFPSIYQAPHADSIQGKWSSLSVLALLHSNKNKKIKPNPMCAHLWGSTKKKKILNLVFWIANWKKLFWNSITAFWWGGNPLLRFPVNWSRSMYPAPYPILSWLWTDPMIRLQGLGPSGPLLQSKPLNTSKSKRRRQQVRIRTNQKRLLKLCTEEEIMWLDINFAKRSLTKKQDTRQWSAPKATQNNFQSGQ